MNQVDETHTLKFTGLVAAAYWLHTTFESLNPIDSLLLVLALIGLLAIVVVFCWERFSKRGRELFRKREFLSEVPKDLLLPKAESITMGRETDLGVLVHLPDSIRLKHVHILGATGSGKTESVILNFIRQDIYRGIGAIIMDAKGDTSFIKSLREWVPDEKLRIFDLSGEASLGYDPLSAGSALEASQRLFSSLTWSEEYYKSKAFSALHRIFQYHFERFDRNPLLAEVDDYLSTPKKFASFVQNSDYPAKLAEADFEDLSGLRDQIKTLNLGHLSKILSPTQNQAIDLRDAYQGAVIYFRLQSLLSPQLVSILGKLLINHLNFLAGTAHRAEGAAIRSKLVPTYLDEFASFACPEFADLISKARSAGMALHFSHQSIGDLAEVSKGFLNQITDNSATKIIMRINDPDTAEYFAKAFGTKIYQKITQRITNVQEVDLAEVVGEGSQREAHQFRASPDLFKTLPTGMGSVLIAHGHDTPHGASSVFKIRFPKLEPKEVNA